MKNILLKLIYLNLILSICLFAQEPLEKVKLQLQWKHQFEFAGFYIAKEKGYYKELGLDVELIEFNNKTNIIQNVLDNDDMYGITYSNLISEYFKDKPLVFVANFFKQSPLALVTQPEISSPSELKNKKIMGVSDQIHSSMFLLIFERFGIKSSDFVSVEPTFNIDDFINKKVDAMTVFTTNEPYFLDKMGYKYNLINPTIYGAEFYDLNLFTTKKELKEHPYRVEKMKEASIKGWKYSLEHKEEVINLILEKYNTQNKTREALLYEAQKIENIMFPSIYEIGSIDENRVKLIVDNLIGLKLIPKDKNIDYKDFIYSKSSIDLTNDEIKYLNSKKNLKACIHPKWYPFEAFDGDQNYIGISSEYMKIFSNLIRKNIDVISTSSWLESLVYLEEGHCDILPIGIKEFTDEDYIDFTKPYFSADLVMIGKKDDRFITNLTDFGKKTVGICKNFKLTEDFKRKYSNIDFIEVENYFVGFKLLEENKISGYINAFHVMSNYLQSNYSDRLKIINKLDEKLNFSVGINKKDKYLEGIFNKAIDKLNDDITQQIKNKYLIPVIEKEKDYKILKIFLFFILISVLFLVIRHYFLYKVNESLKKRIEEEIDKSKSKDNMIFNQNKLIAMGEMIDNIAHQWKQPLNELNCNIMLLDEEFSKVKSNREIYQYLDNIENLTVHMSSTINDFRKFYSTEKKLEKFNIKDTIDSTLVIMAESFKQANIVLKNNVSDNIYIENFINEFKQVLVSILNNAKEAFINSNIQCKEIIISVNEKEKFIELFVEDNAGGIKKEIIDKIFNQHFTTKKNSNGTGLGLYISKMIVENSMKSNIKVESFDNKTIFILIIEKEFKEK